MWTAIVLIVAISAFASVMRARYHGRHDDSIDEFRGRRMHPMAPRQPDPELQREVEALRKRLEVLERITTDERQSKSIAAEIESLRDK
jgi:hypothetical protein